MCRAFEEDQKFLLQKKDDWANALKGLMKEATTSRKRSRESLQRDVEAMSRV